MITPEFQKILSIKIIDHMNSMDIKSYLIFQICEEFLKKEYHTDTYVHPKLQNPPSHLYPSLITRHLCQ